MLGKILKVTLVYAQVVLLSGWTRGYCSNAVTVGDSISRGADITTPFAQIIALAVGNNFEWSATSIGGIGWNTDPGGGTLITRAATDVDPLRSSGLCANPFLVLFAGTNDIFNSGFTGAQTYGFFQTYIAARIAAGWPPGRIFVVTMLPRQNSNEPDRTTYNNDLVSGASTYGYSLVRVDQDPNIGCAGCDQNATYYDNDHIHPTATGQQVLANLICTAMALDVHTGRACPAY